ncbi:hypothetical protein A7U60_g519 [Sanghuangporus baumii]|uniref:Uncharacterized protein n=1 Tax=Sanghuangporus baumii TaxID=108892 RepID=A0A9Q5I5L9_SANBA|nr:hypothetical protein A7U60_g519 [Sanghuangporus baumii]
MIQGLQGLRQNWYRKEGLSITRNERHIRKHRARSGRQDHRGHEYVWYETWDTTLNRAILSLNSLSVAPQSRVSRKIKKRDGGFRIQSRIPDFGLVRRTKYIRKMEGGVEVIKKKLHSRLVAIVEIKPAPADTSAHKVLDALEEAYFDLCAQVGVFAGNPDIKEIIGIFAAGTYWNFEIFARNSGDTSSDDDDDDDDEDDESYKPSSERHSSSEARNESVESWSGESDESSESSPDELDIINKPEDPGRQELVAEVSSESIEETIGADEAYILQTEEGEHGLKLLMEAIENLEGCEEFDGPL